MLDVWEPVVRYMEQAKEQISWQMVKDIAEQSMIDTRAMVAKKGRASYLGERSRGHLDPGAVSSYYFFWTWAEQPWKGDGQ
jgi:phosphoenolpyruvate---glycerone phosphotransferase subunit DhaL